MTKSSLTNKEILTNNHSGPRNHSIDTITPHYMCWYTDGEICAQSFVPASRRASSNYCIGKYGDIVLSVPEEYRAWTSGNSANDNRAITIECANYAETANGHVYGQLPDATWKSLVSLCADICKRYGKKRLIYLGRADYRNIGSTDMLLTKHKWFQDTDCPGPWFDNQFERLAKEVTNKIGTVTIDIADVAARIHYDMVTDPANGYSQGDRWGGQTGKTKTLTIQGRKYTYPLGDYDCASSVVQAWRIALQGTPYEGKLGNDKTTYTGNMIPVFLSSGLFTSSLTPAKRGDLYLRPKTETVGGHTAMCQDGGNDGVFNRDCLTEFNRNELHAATGGRVGDQDSGESIIRDYYNGPWTTVLHYNHKADTSIEVKSVSKKPTQPASKVKNTNGIFYKSHVETTGWLPEVRDGQLSGTTGQSARIEALMITPPPGVWLDVIVHQQSIGNLIFENVRKKTSTSKGYNPVIGHIGKSLRLEAVKIVVKKVPKEFKNKTLKYQVHQQTVGDSEIVTAGHWAGVRGKGKRLEAIKIWFE